MYGGALRRTPVFCLHGVEPQLFEAQLRFLTANNYHTLTTEDLEELMSGSLDSERKSVMLTFDDGWGSLWSVGLPLLKKYGVKVVVFLAAGRIRSGGLGPDLDLRRDSSEHPFLTWEEIGEMHETGLVDFQSHTLTHNRVFCSPRIVDFAHPSLMHECDLLQVPEWNTDGAASPRLGRPVYASSPRTGECRRYLEDPGLRQACEKYVADLGGTGFFRRPRWRRGLAGLACGYRENSTAPDRYETDEERRLALWREMHESKRLIEQHLPGKTVRHVAYPWHCYSKLAVELSSEAGYLTNFVGKLSRRYDGVQRGTPALVARVGEDFLFRLPGKERVPLLRVLLGKLARRTLSSKS